MFQRGITRSGEKCKSLVSAKPTQWETKCQTADIQTSILNRKLGKFEVKHYGQTSFFMCETKFSIIKTPKVKKYLWKKPIVYAHIDKKYVLM